MKRLDAYKQASNDLLATTEIVDGLKSERNAIGTIEISSSLQISSSSSDKQFLFAIGVVNSQIEASKELGLDPKSLDEKKSHIMRLFHISKELYDWTRFLYELQDYKQEVYHLLSDSDKFKLLNYPKK